MAYTDIDDPSAYFQTSIYTGNGGASHAIDQAGNSTFQPNWVWIKKRNGAVNHLLHDSVRGVNNLLVSNTNAADDSNSNIFIGFDDDGFRVGANSASNVNNGTFVAWQWKAGTAFSNDASSTSVGTIDSVGTLNTDSGFSIITYTGTGSNGTIAHGLGAVPGWIWIKRRNSTSNWTVYNQILGAGTKNLLLNSAAVEEDEDTYFNDTAATSSVFSVGTSAGTNGSGDTYVAYCFAQKQGYSKFGSYIGNGNANGSFLYTGFKPAWVLVKSSTYAGSWLLWDNKRSTSGGFNPNHYILVPNNDEAEQTGTNYAIDILSNGFKLTNTNGNVQNSGEKMLYMAFAHQPVVTSKGVPATAF